MAQYGHKKEKKQNLWPWLVLAGFALWGLGVFSWTTVRIGEAYGYNPALGSPVRIGTKVCYSPLTAWQWPAEIWNEPLVDRLANQGLVVFGVPLIAAVLLTVAFRRPKATKDLHGTARWAKKEEIEEMGYLDGKGVYVGGYWDEKKKAQFYLRHNGPEHVLCFAPTRSGKGVGLILPTLLSWPDSAVILDIKGENWALTAAYRQSQGHAVLCFDPSDMDGMAARFNPLEEMRLGGGQAVSDAQQLSYMVMDPEGKGLPEYWDKAAFVFFASVLLHRAIIKLAATGQPATFYDVSVMLEDHKREGGTKAMLKEMMEAEHTQLMLDLFPGIAPDLAEAAHVFIAAGAAGMLAKADKERSGVLSYAAVNMSLYRDPIVARNTACCDFRINDLMHHEKPVSLYLTVSAANIDRLRPLFRIFLAQMCGRLMEKMEFAQGGTKITYKHRLLLMLDEFPALGKLAIIERAIAYMAGYGIKGYFIVQNTQQLAQEYGKDNSLMANCHVRIAYAPNIVETAELLSKMTGTTTVVQYKETMTKGSKGGGSLSVSEVSRPLLTPDECMRLPGIHKSADGRIDSGDMLVFTAGQYPIYGRQILHFMDPVFLKRASMPPPAISDSLYFEREAPVVAHREAAGEESAADAYRRYLYDLPESLEEVV
jgi:type IV secretion system protein VirD4